MRKVAKRCAERVCGTRSPGSDRLDVEAKSGAEAAKPGQQPTVSAHGPDASVSFRPSLIVEGVSAGRTVWAGGVGVLPNSPVWAWSAGRCVAVNVEQVGQALLGGVHVGEHAPSPGAAFAAVVVEQHGFLDAGQLGQQLADRQVQAGVVGLAAQQVGDGQGQHAVEDMDADLLVGPVVHGANLGLTSILGSPAAGIVRGPTKKLKVP